MRHVIYRYVLVDREMNLSDHEFTDFDDAVNAAELAGNLAIHEREYTLTDATLVWTPTDREGAGHLTWPPEPHDPNDHDRGEERFSYSNEQ